MKGKELEVCPDLSDGPESFSISLFVHKRAFEYPTVWRLGNSWSECEHFTFPSYQE